MISIPAPPFEHAPLFDACRNNMTITEAIQAIDDVSASVSESVANYLELAPGGALFEIQPVEKTLLQTSWLKKLYRYYLVAGDQRPVYNDILAGAFSSVCPYCGQQDTQTLDHFLPQGRFPEFALLPQNLVPCCVRCNEEKDTFYPTAATDQVFHPYFDDWPAAGLLQATAEIGDSIGITFSIANSPDIDSGVFARASSHLSTFGLNALYVTQAAIELVNGREEFVEAFNFGGPDALSLELQDRFLRVRWPRHSWRKALYRCLMSNEAFLNGGYLLIDIPQD